MEWSGTVDVSYQMFGLLELPNVPWRSGHWRNGLVRVLTVGAMIRTGIDMGSVNVTVRLHDERSDTIDAAGWDEIVEVSVRSRRGNLRVCTSDRAIVEDLPDITVAGPGWYGLRVHARGRDLHTNKVRSDAPEDYLLASWPAPRAPQNIIRASDHYGASVRLAQAMYPPPFMYEIVEAKRAGLLRQRIVSRRPTR